MTDIETQVMARKYQSILLQVQGMTFSWNVAVRLVGGKKRLERLMAEEKVHFEKPFGSANTKWKFDASDILQHIKPNLSRVK